MYNVLKKILIVLNILIFVLLIPLIIELIFKNYGGEKNILTLLTPDGVLQYIGSIFTAIIAVLGVYYTLKGNRKNDLNNKVIENKPYLKTALAQIDEIDKINIKDEGKICIWDCDMTYSTAMFNINSYEDIVKFCSQNGKKKNRAIFKYSIYNIGLGSAINLKFKILDNGFFQKTIIRNGEKEVLYLLIDNELIKQNGLEVAIQLTYDDIININKYEQREKFFVNYDSVKNVYRWNRGLNMNCLNQK